MVSLLNGVRYGESIILLLHLGSEVCCVWIMCVFASSYRTDAFKALLKPHAYRLLGHLFLYGVLQLLPGQQLLQLQRLSDVYGAVGQHTAHTQTQTDTHTHTHTHTYTFSHINKVIRNYRNVST